MAEAYAQNRPWFLKTRYLLAFLIVLLVPFVFFKGAHAAGYLQNELIDDPVFLNAASMSQPQIQSFLAGKSSYLTNYSVQETESTYPNYGKTVLASQVIYDAAQVYGVNPQVILATLQKEQSLVTDPSPVQSQLDFAMGYGCADSTGCSAYSGLFNQIDNGTWQLRFNYERARGNTAWWNSATTYPCSSTTNYYSPGLFPGNNVTFYDDYGNAYDTFTLTNASTASLYCYTPHAYPGSSEEYYSGSYNFVVSFENWFGSTLDSYALVQASGTSAIYLLDGSSETIYLVPSPAYLQALGLSNTPVDIVASSALSDFTNGGTLSTLIRSTGGTIYLVESGRAYTITGSDVCTAWGLSCFNSSVVQTLSNAFISSLVNAGNLPPLQDYNGTVYLMQNGTKEPVISTQELADLGYSFANVAGMSAINSTQALGPLLIPNGTAVKYPSGNAIYLYDNNEYHLIPNASLITDWGLASALVANPPNSSYSTTAPVATDSLSSFATDANNQTYVVTDGAKINITSSVSSWPVANAVTDANTSLANLPTVTNTSVIRTDDGGFYTVSGGYKEPIPTMTDFYALGYTPSELMSVSDYAASQLSTGQMNLADGTLFRVNNSAAIYLVNSGNSLLIPSPAYFGYFGLNATNIISLPSSVLTNYPNNVTLNELVENPSGSYYVAANNQFYGLSSQLLSAWGVTTSDATSISNQNFISQPSNNSMTYFARTANGAIYYGNGGAAHPIQSYATYLTLGGTPNNTINVSSDFINDCTVGSAL